MSHSRPRSGQLPSKGVAFNSKGGVGKTGLVVSIAVCAQQHGLSVCVLDTDPRADASAWAGLRKGHPPTVIVSDETTLATKLRAVRDARTHDLILIDTAGGMSPSTRIIMQCSDLCVVPTRPSFLDVRAANAFLTLAASLDRRCAVILNQCLHHPARIEDARALYAGYGIEAGPAIRFRVDHQDAVAAGLGVTEHNASGAAAKEVQALWLWMRQLLWSEEKTS